MMIKFWVWLSFFWLFVNPMLSGQTSFFINYDTKDGLPSSEVYNIHCDRDGKVWCTTDRGVSVYDGHQFTNYSTEHGLAHNTNFFIFKDSNDELWFTGWDGSLSLYKNGQFVADGLTDLLMRQTALVFFVNQQSWSKRIAARYNVTHIH